MRQILLLEKFSADMCFNFIFRMPIFLQNSLSKSLVNLFQIFTKFCRHFVCRDKFTGINVWSIKLSKSHVF